jgi:hypothetical protein
MRDQLGDLVDPDQLRRMAAIVLHGPLDERPRAVATTVVARPIADVEAEYTRVREKLLGHGPHVPAPDGTATDSDARRRLSAKLLGSDVPPTTDGARA